MHSMIRTQLQELKELGLHIPLTDDNFKDVVKSMIKDGRLNNFSKLMQNINIKLKCLSNANVLRQLIEIIISANLVDWMEVVIQCTCPSVCTDEKVRALWNWRRFDLVKSCFQRIQFHPFSSRNVLPPLNLETARVILTDAVQKNASRDIIDCAIIIAEATDFLTCVLQLDDKQSDPTVRNLVDHIFLHLNILELHQDQMKPLSMCSKRDMVFGKTLLEMALRGNVCLLPEWLQTLGTLDKTYFGVLDFEFLAPLFSGFFHNYPFFRIFDSSLACNSRDVVILLIRSGLLHQFGSRLKTQLEECRRKGCPRCKYCDAASYLVNSSVPDGPAIQKLLLQSGFLPNRLLFQLPDVLPQIPLPSTMIVSLTSIGQPPPPPTSSASTQDINSVVKAFVQEPYSLLTMAAAKVSTMIGSHCGRTERIGQLPVPKLVQDHVAFRAGDFMLACEKEKEEKRKTTEVFDVAMEDSDILTTKDLFFENIANELYNENGNAYGSGDDDESGGDDDDGGGGDDDDGGGGDDGNGDDDDGDNDDGDDDDESGDDDDGGGGDDEW